MKSPERLLLFSDAVVAIAITLLAIDLPIPHGETSHEFLSSVRHNGEHYVAFAITFVVIASAWNLHRKVWSFAASFDDRLVTVNLLWLFTIVLFPFATSLLHGASGQSVTVHAYRFDFYALLELIDDTAILVMARRLVSTSLVRHDLDPRQLEQATWPCIGAMVGFGLSIPVFFATTYAWILWILGPLAVIQYRRFRRRGPVSTTRGQGNVGR
jgi:uncharacterized membrane protein